jgi:hypothetical protein
METTITAKYNNTKRIKQSIRMLIMVFALSLVSAGAFADEFEPGLPGGSLEIDEAPIDGGLSLLVAAGVGYGAKKVKDMRKKNKETENAK